MAPIFCVMFSLPISDDVRDHLFANAYLMLKHYTKRKKVKTDCCEGVITTNLKEVFLYGMNAILFKAELETNEGKLEASYLVRHQDIDQMEEPEDMAWVAPEEFDDLIPESRKRRNPIRALAKKHLEN